MPQNYICYQTLILTMSSWLLRFLAMVSASLEKIPQKTDPKETGTQKADTQKADDPKADAQKTNAQETDAQKADAQKTDAQTTDTQETGAQENDSLKTHAQKADIQKSHAQMVDVQVAQIVDVQIPDTQMTYVQITDAQMPYVQRAETEIVDAQNAYAQNAYAQNAYAQKADAQKADTHPADTQKADAQKADAQKADVQKADAPKADSQTSELQLRIQKAIRGLVLAITSVDDERYPAAETYAYGALSVCCALPYLDGVSIAELAPEFGYDAFRYADRRPDVKDPTTRLLQWAHLMAIEKIHQSPFRPMELYTQAELKKVKEAQTDYYNLALDRTDLRTVFNEDAGHTEEDFGVAIIREELWNKIALLAIDLFGRSSLADQVSQRMAAREADKLGKIPPWGIRCLDHAIHVELAAMRAKLGSPMSNTREIIQEAYENISYFRRSDFSLLRCSSGIGSPSWASDLLGLDSIIICSSLLSIILQDFPEGKRIPFFNVHLTN